MNATTNAVPPELPPLPQIAMQPVQSTMLAAHGYDAATQILVVQFAKGGSYRHDGVPLEVARGLAGAESPGSYYGKNIRGKFVSSKLDEPKGE